MLKCDLCGETVACIECGVCCEVEKHQKENDRLSELVSMYDQFVTSEGKEEEFEQYLQES